MTIARPRLCAALITLLLAGMPLSVAWAQENQGIRDPSEWDSTDDQQPAAAHQTAQVGAGTDNGTTTGFSGPKKKGGSKGKPPEPQASLCERYDGGVKQSCLETVLRKAPQRKGG